MPFFRDPGGNPIQIGKFRGWRVNRGDDLNRMKALTCPSCLWYSPKGPPFPHMQNSHVPFAKKLCVLGATALGSLYK